MPLWIPTVGGDDGGGGRRERESVIIMEVEATDQTRRRQQQHQQQSDRPRVEGGGASSPSSLPATNRETTTTTTELHARTAVTAADKGFDNFAKQQPLLLPLPQHHQHNSALSVLGRRALARAAMASVSAKQQGSSRSSPFHSSARRLFVLSRCITVTNKYRSMASAASGAAAGGRGGKKAPKKKPRLLRESSVTTNSKDQMVSTLKSSIACPSHMLKVIMKQTDLDEPTIHSRYMRFRKEFPTGFISHNALLALCNRALSKEESEVLVDAIFALYGRKRKGWHTRFIGFREIILATECMRNLSRPEKVLRWIFKVNDFNGVGAVAVQNLQDIVGQIISLCITTKPQSADKELHKALVDATMMHFHMLPYDKENITEEEFVYDCLHNEALYNILNKSIRLSALGQAAQSQQDAKAAADAYVSDIIRKQKQQKEEEDQQAQQQARGDRPSSSASRQAKR